jgi:hypothetical protein
MSLFNLTSTCTLHLPHCARGPGLPAEGPQSGVVTWVSVPRRAGATGGLTTSRGCRVPFHAPRHTPAARVHHGQRTQMSAMLQGGPVHPTSLATGTKERTPGQQVVQESHPLFMHALPQLQRVCSTALAKEGHRASACRPCLATPSSPPTGAWPAAGGRSPVRQGGEVLLPSGREEKTHTCMLA